MNGITGYVSEELSAQEEQPVDEHAKPPVAVYDGSVSVDVLLENGLTECVYDNLTIEGYLITRIHPNLHKGTEYYCTPPEYDESYFTDLVISRDGASVRFGELNYATTRGRVLFSQEPRVRFEEEVGEGLGVHYPFEGSSSVIVYREEDYLHTHREKKGVMVFAPNFICPQGDAPFTPATSIDRPGYIKIQAKGPGDLRDIHVKGSLIVDKFIRLYRNAVPPIGGWYFGNHSGEWYQPPKWMIIPEKQNELGVAEEGDLVISRGNASVLIRKDGSVIPSGLVAVLFTPVSYGEGECLSVDSQGRSENSTVLTHRIIVVFQ